MNESIGISEYLTDDTDPERVLNIDHNGMVWSHRGVPSFRVDQHGITLIRGEKERRITPRRQWFWHRVG